MLTGKTTMILLTVVLIKQIQLYQMSYFAEPHTQSKNKKEVELDLTNDATKSDLENRS